MMTYEQAVGRALLNALVEKQPARPYVTSNTVQWQAFRRLLFLAGFTVPTFEQYLRAKRGVA